MKVQVNSLIFNPFKKKYTNIKALLSKDMRMENCFFEEKIKVDSKSLSPDMEKSPPKDKS